MFIGKPGQNTQKVICSLLNILVASARTSMPASGLYLPRNRTIPHKAFESAFLATPYLTAGNKGIAELFTEGIDVECFSPGNSLALVDSIRNLIIDHDKLNKMSYSIHEKYKNICNQKMLSQNFLKIVLV